MIISNRDIRLDIAVPAGAQTLAGFREWVYSGTFPESGKISLIDGQLLIDMNAERYYAHSKVKDRIARVVGGLVDDDDLGEFLPDRVWITNDDANLSTEPDSSFGSWESIESGRLQLIPTSKDGVDGIEFRGSPDWVLAVISTSSVTKDTRLLPAAYHRAGVREFWLVDARDELEFTIFVHAESGYIAAPSQEGWIASPVFGKEFRLSRRPSRGGGWRYSLDVR